MLGLTSHHVGRRIDRGLVHGVQAHRRHPRPGMVCLTIALGLLLSGSKPYEDTKQRFSVRLPDGWTLKPRFGDLWGMTFDRNLEAGSSSALTIHVDPVPAIDVAGFATAAEAAWRGNGAVTALVASRATVAGRPAIVRDSEQDGRHIRAYFLESGGHYYHLRFEVEPALLRTIEPEWRAIIGSLVPGKGVAPRGTVAAPSALPPGLTGTWRGKSGVVLVLKAERTFTMAGLKGRYAAEDDTLVLVVPGRAPLRFGLGLDGDTLTLTAPNLAEPAVYARASADEGTLVGAWRTEGGGTTLSMTKAGTFVMGELSGRWEASEDRLILRGERGEDVTYRYALEGGGLTLSGGDLESPLSFRRAR